jgi:hypothetical protein
MIPTLEPDNIIKYHDMCCFKADDTMDYHLNFQFIKDLPPDEVHKRALSARKVLGKAEKRLHPGSSRSMTASFFELLHVHQSTTMQRAI